LPERKFRLGPLLGLAPVRTLVGAETFNAKRIAAILATLPSRDSKSDANRSQRLIGTLQNEVLPKPNKYSGRPPALQLLEAQLMAAWIGRGSCSRFHQSTDIHLLHGSLPHCSRKVSSLSMWRLRESSCLLAQDHPQHS
jgi:hypothetical protein